MRETLIFVPTYNERENIGLIYERIKKLGLDADILFLDDRSPDGTGQIADRIAAQDASVQVIHRPVKNGIGSAHREGIRRAYDRGYRTLLTMDCDFTHQPEDIPVFMAHSEDVDVVIGSRFMRPDSLKDWHWFRKWLTAAGHFMTKRLLKMPQDASGAFRLYRLDRVRRAVFDRVEAAGYSFFFESLHVLALNGYQIKEIPIKLPARVSGHSKMTARDAVIGLSLLLKTYFRTLFDRQKYLCKR